MGSSLVMCENLLYALQEKALLVRCCVLKKSDFLVHFKCVEPCQESLHATVIAH